MVVTIMVLMVILVMVVIVVNVVLVMMVLMMVVISGEASPTFGHAMQIFLCSWTEKTIHF